MKWCLCFFDSVVDAINIFQQRLPLIWWKWDAFFPGCPFAFLLIEFTNVDVCLPFELSNRHASIFGQFEDRIVLIILLCLLHWSTLHLQAQIKYEKINKMNIIPITIKPWTGIKMATYILWSRITIGRWGSSLLLWHLEMRTSTRFPTTTTTTTIFSSKLLQVFRCETLKNYQNCSLLVYEIDTNSMTFIKTQ